MNLIYLGMSIDGYIADRNGNLDFLSDVDIPEGDDLGFSELLNRIDALIMGRNTYDTVMGFGVEWPYPKQVFVATSRPLRPPPEISDRVEAVSGSVDNILAAVHARGFRKLYIDGGKLIKDFLASDRIDEMVLSRMPVLLGGGVPLFGEMVESLKFEHLGTEVLAGQIVKSSYRRKRQAASQGSRIA